MTSSDPRWLPDVLFALLAAVRAAPLGDDATGRCWVCAAPAEAQCDQGIHGRPGTPLCDRWLCWAHATVVHQPWDVLQLDGVDIRCPEHVQLASMEESRG
jgi:hypothetical protein